MSHNRFGGDYKDPLTLNKWLYVNGNPIIYTDPSGYYSIERSYSASLSTSGINESLGTSASYGSCPYEMALVGKCGCETQQKAFSQTKNEWNSQKDYILGFAYQVANDILLNLPNLFFGESWQKVQSYEFQTGQSAGRSTSTVIGTALTINGALNMGAGIASLLPTISGGAACTLATGGACAVVVVPAVAGEGVLIGVGAIEGALGGGILAINSTNPLPSPKYTANNFRNNLKNQKPIPNGLKKPEAHHVLPQKFRHFFSDMGINVDDPKWGAWVEGGTHQSWSSSYNNAWDNWLFVHKNPTIREIEKEALDLSKLYGYTWP